MIAIRSRFVRRLLGAPSLVVLCGLLFSGCQTPDLKPFASASTSLVASINQGGDLVIAPLANETFFVGDKLIPPDSPDHPARQLQTAWEARRKTAEAILGYSASLSAIGAAAANRKENATALVESVKQLAAKVPGVSVGSNAAGNLAVFVLGTAVEVKAFNDLSAAVTSADPAVQLIAGALHLDFVSFSQLYETQQRGKIIQDTPALFRLERFYAALKAKQNIQRDAVAADLADVAKSTELARIDGLLAGVETDRTNLRADVARLQAALGTGKSFFAAAVQSIDDWAAAHAEIAKALKENRSPNLTLLASRAHELASLIADLKSANHPNSTP